MTEKVLYDTLYEYLRQCGLDDAAAVDLALNLQSAVQSAAMQAGGDPESVPEE